MVKHTADWEPMEAGDKIDFDYGGGAAGATRWSGPLLRCSTTSSTST